MLDKYAKYTQPALRKWAKFTFDAKVRARLYRKIAALLDNGVKLSKAIDTLQARSATKGATETLAIILADVRATLDQGAGLSTALLPWVDSLECMGIAAGERSGDLGKALKQTADSLGGTKEMIKAVRNGLAYPTILLIATIATIYFVGAIFLPELTSLASPDQFTGVAASLYHLSEFVQSIWFWVLVIGFLGSIVAIITLLPRAHGDDRFRVKLDNIPPWSIYRLLVGSSFLVSLSALLRAGVQLQDALGQTIKFANPYLAVRITGILTEISKGRTFGDALDAARYEFPDKEIIDDLITYSTLPNFDKILYEYGQEWMTEGVESVKAQAAILQSVAVMFMSGVIIWLVLGVMQIQQQLGAALQQMN